jgi:hypothetical protein
VKTNSTMPVLKTQQKSPPFYVTGVKIISLLIPLIEQIAKQQYEVKELSDNQVTFRSKNN